MSYIYSPVFIAIILSCINNVPLGEALHKDGPCIPEGCKCFFPNRKVLDLFHRIPISSINIKNQANLSIIFHPCQDYKFGNTDGSNECYAGASICLYNMTSNITSILGKAGKGVFGTGDSTQNMDVKFTEKNRVTTLKLICNPDAQDDVTATKIGENNYELVWTSASNASCPLIPEDNIGLSTGSMLVIMLMVFTMVYFGGGMLALKYLRGAEGKEMIPNYDFWVDLPYLVRDGILFSLGGFNSPTSYDRI